MKAKIYSWNPNSESAKALKDALGIQKIKSANSTFKGSNKKTVINWGSSKVPEEVLKCRILNHPDNVGIVSNKLKFFRLMKEKAPDLIPEFWEEITKALEKVADGMTVVARKVLQGHSGEGIVVMTKNDPDTFAEAPLYVRYIPKNEEYRVHVLEGKVIDVQRKTLSKEKAAEGNEINWKIRNLQNGFIYQREGVHPSQEVLDAALKGIEISGLDFGGVDIVVHKKENRPYLLEINSAPGLQGATIESYKKAFEEIL